MDMDNMVYMLIVYVIGIFTQTDKIFKPQTQIMVYVQFNVVNEKSKEE